MYCSKCGAKNEKGTIYCTSCGEKLEEVKKKRGFWKFIVWLLILAGLLVGGFFLYKSVIGFFPQRYIAMRDRPVFYVKNQKLYAKLGNKEPVELPANTDGYGYLSVSKNGDFALFVEHTDSGSKLYYSEFSDLYNESKKAVQLASSVSSWNLSPDSKYTIYIKNNKLYYSDFKEEKKLADDVEWFFIGNDSNKVIYKYKNNDLYMCNPNGEGDSEKIASNVDVVIHENDEYKTLYYTKKEEDGLYMKKVGEEAVKLTDEHIDEDIYENCAVINNTLFFALKSEHELYFSDLFEDDMAEADSKTFSPRYDDFKKVKTDIWGDTYMGYDEDAFKEARKKYEAVLERDEIRDFYDENPEDTYDYKLYMVEGNGVKELTSGIYKWNNDLHNQIFAIDENPNKKIKMSEVEDLYDAKDKVRDKLYHTPDSVVYSIFKADGSIISTQKQEKLINDYLISKDKKYFYFIEDNALKCADITDSGLKNEATICQDSKWIDWQGEVMFIIGEHSIGLYKDGKYSKVADNSSWVYGYDCNYDGDNEYSYYRTNIDDGSVGELMRSKNSKSESIDVDVSEAYIRDDNMIYYIKDYNKESRLGDLYCYKDGKKTKIDHDVSYVWY